MFFYEIDDEIFVNMSTAIRFKYLMNNSLRKLAKYLVKTYLKRKTLLFSA